MDAHIPVSPMAASLDIIFEIPEGLGDKPFNELHLAVADLLLLFPQYSVGLKWMDKRENCMVPVLKSGIAIFFPKALTSLSPEAMTFLNTRFSKLGGNAQTTRPLRSENSIARIVRSFADGFVQNIRTNPSDRSVCTLYC